MENKGLTFTNEEHTAYCNIAVQIDCYEVYDTVDVLLDCLSQLEYTNRYYICQLIRALLPSQEQMKLIANSQLQENPHEENKQLAMQVECLKNENERLVMNLDAVKETKEVLNAAIKAQDVKIETKDRIIKDMQNMIDTLKNTEKITADLKQLESSIQE